MERKNIFHVDRTLGKRTTKDLLLRSVMAFTLVHQPTLITASPDSQHHLDSSAREQVSERASVFEDKTPNVPEIVVFPSPIQEITVKPETAKNLQPSTEVTAPDWTLDPEISFYGPGLYGRRTACGLELTKDLKGVAHRDLPCGTNVTFEWEGIIRTFPVVDRGPYVDGRIFDLTGGACMDFKTEQHPKGHCLTGRINYIIEKIPSNFVSEKAF